MQRKPGWSAGPESQGPSPPNVRVRETKCNGSQGGQPARNRKGRPPQTFGFGKPNATEARVVSRPGIARAVPPKRSGSGNQMQRKPGWSAGPESQGPSPPNVRVRET